VGRAPQRCLRPADAVLLAVAFGFGPAVGVEQQHFAGGEPQVVAAVRRAGEETERHAGAFDRAHAAGVGEQRSRVTGVGEL
jgi:hypothetical protein